MERLSKVDISLTVLSDAHGSFCPDLPTLVLQQRHQALERLGSLGRPQKADAVDDQVGVLLVLQILDHGRHHGDVGGLFQLL